MLISRNKPQQIGKSGEWAIEDTTWPTTNRSSSPYENFQVITTKPKELDS